MKNRKISVLTGIATTLMLALTSCGVKDSAEEKNVAGNSQQESVSEAASEETDNTDLNNKNSEETEQTLEFVVNNAEAEEFYREAITAFEESHPGVKVELNAIVGNTTEYQQITEIRFAQKEFPDVMAIPVLDVKRLASMGILEALDERISEEDRADYGDGMMATASYEDNIYALPFYTDDIALFYNKDMVEKAGIAMPASHEEAWDWETLIENAKRTQEANGTAYALSIHPDASIFMPLLYSNKATVLNADQTAAGINSPEAVETIKWFKSWFDEGLAPLEIYLNGSPDMLFLQGEVPFMFYFGGAGGTLKATNQESSNPINFSATYMPVQQSAGNKLGGWQVVLFNENEEINDLAYEFASFLLNEENMTSICEKMGTLPTRQSAQENADFGELNEISQILMEEIANIPVFCVNDFSLPEYKTYKAILQSGLQKAVIGDMTVEEACADMEEQINKEVFGN